MMLTVFLTTVVFCSIMDESLFSVDNWVLVALGATPFDIIGIKHNLKVESTWHFKPTEKYLQLYI